MLSICHSRLFYSFIYEEAKHPTTNLFPLNIIVPCTYDESDIWTLNTGPIRFILINVKLPENTKERVSLTLFLF